jgi:GMP synthase (glutamine-hydrolysing)
MRKILVVKTGSTMPSLVARRGDFEDWILSGMGFGQGERWVVDVRDGTPLPGYEELSGVVVTGSHAMVTEHWEWSERTAGWLAGCVERGVPTLGICYGHQLLAYALGGEVGDNPSGRNFSTIPVHLVEAAEEDALLGGLPTPFLAQVGHTQAVLRLPERALRLATSARDQNQAFRVGEWAWGVQFHPEFDSDIVRAYIEEYRDVLIAEGQDPAELAANSVDASVGTEILRRFVKIVDQHDQSRLTEPGSQRLKTAG